MFKGNVDHEYRGVPGLSRDSLLAGNTPRFVNRDQH